jgi:hypothetical protein
MGAQSCPSPQAAAAHPRVQGSMIGVLSHSRQGLAGRHRKLL